MNRDEHFSKHAESPGTAAGTRYDGFFSYSHDSDRKITAELQRRTTRVGTPWWKLSSRRLFRDEEDLGAAPDLWSVIKENLAGSRHFILVASRESAKSEWVAKELTYWLTGFKEEDPAKLTRQNVLPEQVSRLILVVTKGAIQWDNGVSDFDWATTDAVPAMLRKVFEAEPLWVDVTKHQRLPWGARGALLHEASCRLASFIFRIPLNVLLAAEHRRRRQAVMGTAAAILLTGLLAAWAFLLWKQREVAREKVREETGRFYFAAATKSWEEGDHHEALAYIDQCLEFDPGHPIAASWAIEALASRNWPRPWAPPWTIGEEISHVCWPFKSVDPMVVDGEAHSWELDLSTAEIKAKRGDATWKATPPLNVPYVYRDQWRFVPTWDAEAIFEDGGNIYFVGPNKKFTCWKNGDPNQAELWPIPLPDWDDSRGGGVNFDPVEKKFWFWTPTDAVVFNPSNGEKEDPYPIEEMRGIIKGMEEPERAGSDQLAAPTDPIRQSSALGIKYIGFPEGSGGPLLNAVIGENILVWDRSSSKRLDISWANKTPASDGRGLPQALSLPSRIYLPSPDPMQLLGTEVGLNYPITGPPIVDRFNQRLIFSYGQAVSSVAMAGMPLPLFQKPHFGMFEARLTAFKGSIETWSPAQAMILIDYEKKEVANDVRTGVVNSHSWETGAEDIPGEARAIDSTCTLVAAEPRSGTLQFWDIADRQAEPEPTPVVDHDRAQISTDGEWTLTDKSFKKRYGESGVRAFEGAYLLITVLRNDSFVQRSSIILPMREGDANFVGDGWATPDGKYFYAAWFGVKEWKVAVYNRDGKEVWQGSGQPEGKTLPKRAWVLRGSQVIVALWDGRLLAGNLEQKDVPLHNLQIPTEADEKVVDIEVEDETEAAVRTSKGLRRYSLGTGQWVGPVIPAGGTFIWNIGPKCILISQALENGGQAKWQIVNLESGKSYPELLVPSQSQASESVNKRCGLVVQPPRNGFIQVRVASWEEGEFISPEIAIAPEETRLTSAVWLNESADELLFFTRGCAHRLRIGRSGGYTVNEVKGLRQMLRSVGALILDKGTLRVQTPDERWEAVQSVRQQDAASSGNTTDSRSGTARYGGVFSRFRAWFSATTMEGSVYPDSAVTVAALAGRMSLLPTATELMQEAHRRPYEAALQSSAAYALAFERLAAGNGYIPNEDAYNLQVRSKWHLSEAVRLDENAAQDVKKKFALIESWKSVFVVPAGAEQIASTATDDTNSASADRPLAGLRCRILTGSPMKTGVQGIVGELRSEGAEVTEFEVKEIPSVADRWVFVAQGMEGSGANFKMVERAAPLRQARVFQLITKYLPSARLGYGIPTAGIPGDELPDVVITIQ